MMMGANLVGFVLGTQGVSYMLEQLFTSWEGKFATHYSSLASYQDFPNTLRIVGIRFMVFTCICLFVPAQVMFEYRYAVSYMILRVYLVLTLTLGSLRAGRRKFVRGS